MLRLDSIPERSYNLDLLRILASILVVILHVAGAHWTTVDVYSPAWKTFCFYNSTTRSCVPLFFMISGQLFLSKSQISLSQLYKKNILRLIIIYFFWAALYAITYRSVTSVLYQGSFAAYFTGIIHAKYHLWFLPALIGVYCIAPLLFSIAKFENGNYLPYSCLLFFLFSIMRSTLLMIPFRNPDIVTLLKLLPYELIGYSGYFLLGYYLSKHDYRKLHIWQLVSSLVLVLGVAVAINIEYAENLGRPSGMLFDWMKLPNYMSSIIIYILFQKLGPKVSGMPSERLRKMIMTIAKCSFTVYLLHPFILDRLLIWFGISSMSFSPWASIPIIAVAVYVVCVFITLLLNRIPLVKKWLI